MNEEIKQRLLNIGSNIKDNIFSFLFLFMFSKEWNEKIQKNMHFFFYLDVNKFNSPSIIGSFSLGFL
jgi:hypothetical protein